jgi:hypothetical protein
VKEGDDPNGQMIEQIGSGEPALAHELKCSESSFGPDPRTTIPAGSFEMLLKKA